MEEKGSDPICSNFKQSIFAANFATHSAFCERNIRVCKICLEPVRIVAVKEHLEEYHVRITCEDCGFPLEKWLLTKHREVCSKRLVPCQFCEAEFRFDEFSSHFEFCSSKTEKCMVCQKYVMLKDKSKHTELHLKNFVSKPTNDEVKQNVINEAISLQDASKSSPEKVESKKQSTLSSLRASQNDSYLNRRDLTEAGACADNNKKEVSKHYGQCHICKQKVPWIDMNLHIPNCADEAGKCSRCGEFVPNSDIKEHIFKTCKMLATKSNLRSGYSADISSSNVLQESTKGMRDCLYCGQPCSDDRIFEHMKNCSENCFECSMCGEKIPEKDKDVHGSMQCKALLDSGPESFYDASKYTTSRNADKNRSKNSSENYTSKNKTPVYKSDVLICELCHEEYDTESKDVHSKFCRPLRHNNNLTNYASSVNADKDESKKSSKNHTRKNKSPVFKSNILICELCHEEYNAELKDVHIEMCRPLRRNINRTNFTASASAYEDESKRSLEITRNARNKISHPQPDSTVIICEFCLEEYDEKIKDVHLQMCRAMNCFKNEPEMELQSYAGAARKNNKNMSASQILKKTDEILSAYCTCLNCNEDIRKERMREHLLVCKKNEKIPCIYCEKIISVKREAEHLEICEALNASLNNTKVPDNKNDYKGVIPKNSKFAQLAKVKIGKCSYCETTLNSDILLYHENECIHKSIPCDKCCVPVKIKDLENHVCKSGKGKKGKRGGNAKKEEKSDAGFGIKKCFKNFFGYTGEEEVNDKSKKEENRQTFNARDYTKDNCFSPYNQNYYSRNEYGYLDGNIHNQYNYSSRNINDEFNKSFMDEEDKIPCEFCEKLFPVSEIILHSTGCDPASANCSNILYPKSEDVKESKSSLKKTDNVKTNDATRIQNFFSGGPERNFHSSRPENLHSRRLGYKNDTESPIMPGEFIRDKFNMNTLSESLSNKPDVVKESENSTKFSHSKIQSVWNMDSPEADMEAEEIFPRDSPPEEKIFHMNEYEMEFSDITQKTPEDGNIEADPEMSSMLDYILDDKIYVSDENSSISSENGNFQPDRAQPLPPDLGRNKAPVAAYNPYERAYKLLKESKNINFNKNKVESPYFAVESSVRHEKKAFSIEPAVKFPISSSEKDKSFAKKVEMEYQQYQENKKNLHRSTQKGDEKFEDDVSKWQKWSVFKPD